MRATAIHLDRLLRSRPGRGESAAPPALLLLGVFVGGAMIYGAVMGAFSLRPLQMFYAAVKVPMLLGITFLLSLPSFFMLNTLLGLRGDFARTMSAMLSAGATFTLTLLALAPLTAFWYASSSDYEIAILFNSLMFTIATNMAHLVLRRRYRPLIAADRRHAWVLRVWIVTFIFVGIQMGWVLRPFVGSPFTATRFFRADAWSNAYELVGKMVWSVAQRAG